MKDIKNISVATLGPSIDHQKSLLAMLSNGVGSVTTLPDSHSFYKIDSAPSRFKKIIGKVWKPDNKAYLEMICQKLDDSSTDVIIGYWGTNPISDLFSIKKLRPHIKVVLMVLCHPMSLNNLGIRRQNFMMQRATASLDGIIYPSINMAEYFNKTIYKKKMPCVAIIPPCWPEAFQAKKNARELKDESNIVFIGRTDLSGKTVHLADDVRPLMNSILAQGIDLYHGESKETNDNNPHRKAFKPMEQKALIETMSYYDASLLAYNTEACKNDLRFHLTVPDRLITSVSAGIPIAIPSEGYGGAKSYLKNYPAIFEFDSACHLKSMLADRSHVRELKNIAWETRERYTAEKQGDKLNSFIMSLM